MRFGYRAGMRAKTMQDILRQAIRESGKSALQIAKEAGLSQPTVSEFLRGKDIRISSAQKLAALFGFELKPHK